ncbi:MAG: metalloregulator ArsR/SmtB family transcription factor [Planctomycetota bacterium]|nr:metalloregulator ArsR/SmtB family transcription factor [Planctomycetota bacterium]
MEDTQFQRICKALADPQRFAILQRIARESEVACMHLVAEFPIRPATISHHMRELSKAGLVEIRKEGKCAHLRVVRGVLAQYQRELRKRLSKQEL